MATLLSQSVLGFLLKEAISLGDLPRRPGRPAVWSVLLSLSCTQVCSLHTRAFLKSCFSPQGLHDSGSGDDAPWLPRLTLLALHQLLLDSFCFVQR